MAEVFANFVSTTLNGAINNAVTSVVVASATGFPNSAQYRVIVDNEIMLVTGGAGTTTWTVTRGAEGTTAASHNDGSTVYHIITAGALAQLKADAIAGITGTAPVSVSSGTISIPDATGGQKGLMTTTQAALLATATSANTASALMQRDSNGDVQVRNIVVNGLSSVTAGSPTYLVGYNGSNYTLTAFNTASLVAGTIASQANSATINASSTNTAGDIVRRDGSGHIFGTYFNSSALSGAASAGGAPASIVGVNGSDGYLRSYNPASITVGTATNANGLNNGTTDGDKLHSINITTTTTSPGFTWHRSYLPNGKRIYVTDPASAINVALAAAVDQLVVNNSALPDSLNLNQVYIAPPTVIGTGSQNIAAQIRGYNNGQIQSNNYFQVALHSLNGGNLNTITTYVDLMLMIVEL